jgi:hypothetical protein
VQHNRLKILAALVVCISCNTLSGRRTVGGAVDLTALGSVAAIYPHIPQQPDIVLEIDVAGLRAKPDLAMLWTRLSTIAGLSGANAFDGLSARADWDQVRTVVVASYAVGTANAQTLTLLQSTGDASPSKGAIAIASRLWALGPEALVAQALPSNERATGVLSSSWFALRQRAIIKGAPPGVVRVTAQLPSEARQGLSPLLGVDAVPSQLAAWLDIVDDAAMIIVTQHESNAQLQRWQRITQTLPQVSWARTLGLAPSLAQARWRSSNTWSQLTIVVAPGPWRRCIERMVAMLPPPGSLSHIPLTSGSP